MNKPKDLFDRDIEWSNLVSFASSNTPGASLGIVYGRRRQGKTLLLELLAEQTNGFVFSGLQQTSAQSLADLGRASATFRGLSSPLYFVGWQEAIADLLSLGESGKSQLVVLDEFPYLMEAAPELPSIIQAALSPRGRAKQKSKTRLILCGSAFSVMARLLSGTAPLRGRAPLEMLVHSFSYRQAAGFWRLKGKWGTAFRVHALCGGTPAYLDYCSGDVPRGPRDFDRWVVANLLDPSRAFFREGRALLSEESKLNDMALYFSVLSALSNGKTRRGEIAAYLGRKESALAHPLAVLEEARLIVRREDPLREKRNSYQIAEPMLRFHQLLIRPNETKLNRHAAKNVWDASQSLVNSNIYGPHFEDLCREWTTYAEFLPKLDLATVGRTEIGCRIHKTQHEVDVVAIDQNGRVVAIGEAKWNVGPVGIDQLERLIHIRDLLPRAKEAKLMIFGANGFSSTLRKSASEGVELIDLQRLYEGSG